MVLITIKSYAQLANFYYFSIQTISGRVASKGGVEIKNLIGVDGSLAAAPSV